jgi:hypothetical protein
VSCKECVGQGEFQGCEPEKNIEGLLLQVCVESKCITPESGWKSPQGVHARILFEA